MTETPRPATTKERLVAAAYELFEERGFDATKAEDIARRAGVGRTTFFRAFGSKDDVIFPEHDLLLGRIDGRLAAATPATRTVALSEAARVVLRHYVAEGEMARARYRLVGSVPALRARETGGIQQYQRVFTRWLRDWMSDLPDGHLRAELLAADLVTAHNYVLRRWLRDQTSDPEGEFDQAMRVALERYQPVGLESASTVVVLRTTATPAAIQAQLQPLLDDETP
ncbi:transcriptional regulator, TetR family [Nocardioidaceae bacterium Broad-1]|uniref:AcrR family transcriptional regulator n=1 Tax=Nocardioides panzhihuensis TaxID=860243 RepID=A0A7Z0DMN0_9ACTN|nr:TetR family transcriptional regulator [Nocardioides panzhihuensis]EGD43938.1 transcriptional regulator, TetR family [Nocardioidaceae bacterium Broad-1]NYI78208.1 AcrR family transcriptional regulator [Nocardioides panzhihuensis]